MEYIQNIKKKLSTRLYGIEKNRCIKDPFSLLKLYDNKKMT